MELEELPVGADAVVGPARRGLRRLGAAPPAAEVAALREHFAQLGDPRGGHHLVGDQGPHQGFLPRVEANFPRPGDDERELAEQPREPLAARMAPRGPRPLSSRLIARARGPRSLGGARTPPARAPLRASQRPALPPGPWAPIYFYQERIMSLTIASKAMYV